MFRLTNRLALSNLIKNRKLYYPYTLATILVIAITYIFTSLTLNSHLDDLTWAVAIRRWFWGWDLELSPYPLGLLFFMPNPLL